MRYAYLACIAKWLWTQHNKSGLMLDHEGTAAAAVAWQYFIPTEDE